MHLEQVESHRLGRDYSPENDATAQVTARVSAAKSVLDLSLKAREIFELEDRIAYLEKYLEITGGRRSA
ncbi:MAG: hypothetical protein IPM55_23305 [Acidobacteria bacterium]|nr:hypothetical protein [Acidobacteriota bacterium]